MRGNDQDSRALAYFLWDLPFLQMQLPMPLLYVCLLSALELRADEIVGNVGKSVLDSVAAQELEMLP